MRNTVSLDIVRYGVLEETQVYKMRFGIIVDYKLRKAVGVGIFKDQQLALPAAGNHGGRLVGI